MTKQGTGAYRFNIGPNVKSISITITPNSRFKQRMIITDLTDGVTVCDHTFVYGNPVQQATAHNPNGVARSFSAHGQWAHPNGGPWIDSDYAVHAVQPTIVVGWDDDTNIIGGNPDGDFDDVKIEIKFNY